MLVTDKKVSSNVYCGTSLHIYDINEVEAVIGCQQSVVDVCVLVMQV